MLVQESAASFVTRLRRRRPQPGDKWHIDEVCIRIHGVQHDLWRAVDQGGVALDIDRLALVGERGIASDDEQPTATGERGNDIRNAQQSVVAVDIIALMDALKIQKAIIAGYDWGARTACIIAVLWPERCKALVSVSGYLPTNLEDSKRPLPPAAEHGWWYQFYFATDRGQAGYNKYRREFAELIWETASPKWNFDAATFDRSSALPPGSRNTTNWKSDSPRHP
jgi:pimeloyl-ACP methyl ester carboxylesterase